jgi:hypothetical protein
MAPGVGAVIPGTQLTFALLGAAVGVALSAARAPWPRESHGRGGKQERSQHNSLAKAFDLSIDVNKSNLIQNSGSLFPIRLKNPCLHVEGTDGRAIPLCSESGHSLRLQSAKQPRILRAAWMVTPRSRL